eukprot:tig00001527_g9254.t1
MVYNSGFKSKTSSLGKQVNSTKESTHGFPFSTAKNPPLSIRHCLAPLGAWSGFHIDATSITAAAPRAAAQLTCPGRPQRFPDRTGGKTDATRPTPGPDAYKLPQSLGKQARSTHETAGTVVFTTANRSGAYREY